MTPFDLGGRVALITGANSGIGQGVALALASAGADLVLVGRNTPDETSARAQAFGRTVRFLRADLSTTRPINAIIGEALSGNGKIDILVNNAGTIRRADAVDVTEADWDAVVSTNLKSAFFLAQAVGRHMLTQRYGKIINIASLLSFQGGIRVAGYTASKSGLAGITRLLANEWAGRGVNVNAIAPGYVATENTAALRADPQRNAEIMARIPAGRWATPEDIGGAAVFLASDAAKYVHGHVLAVDGGWLAR